MNKTDFPPRDCEHGLCVYDGLSKGQEKHYLNKSLDMVVQLEWCEPIILSLALYRLEESQYSLSQAFYMLQKSVKGSESEFFQGENLYLTKPPPSETRFEFSSVPIYLSLFFGRGFLLRFGFIFFIC